MERNPAMAMPRIILIMLIFNTLLAVGGIGFSFTLYQSVQQLTQVGPAEAGTGGPAGDVEAEKGEYQFQPVDKLIVSLAEAGREHYIVFDLVLQAGLETEKKKLEQIDPMVRNSAVAHFTGMKFQELRGQSIAQLQAGLEKAVLGDFGSRNLLVPFEHVLISKMVVQ
ncbi:MAG: flagellar basal body-associated FliL family protein [Pseudomonas sp.]|uniref:flagellar basal body-associated FliL family protein n=1 Tax=Pseudomonas sp. TaxID=306 RepID=UPI003399C2A6